MLHCFNLCALRNLSHSPCDPCVRTFVLECTTNGRWWFWGRDRIGCAREFAGQQACMRLKSADIDLKRWAWSASTIESKQRPQHATLRQMLGQPNAEERRWSAVLIAHWWVFCEIWYWRQCLARCKTARIAKVPTQRPPWNIQHEDNQILPLASPMMKFL